MFFFFNDTATTEIYTLSLHDALPISATVHCARRIVSDLRCQFVESTHLSHRRNQAPLQHWSERNRDRKSTRLNSSHSQISYAVFCLKKKNQPPRATVCPRDA